MKKSVYFFSENLKQQVVQSFDFVQNDLEFISFQNLSAEETLHKKFDFIELGEGDFELFKPHLKAINWKTNHIGVADLLVQKNNGYKPFNLSSDCIVQVIKNKKYLLNTAQSAMIIGSYDFVLSMAAKMALLGYSHLIISLFESSRNLILERKLKEFIFNLNMTFIKLNELTQIQSTSGLLISNVSEQMDSEAFESLTYFNFLSQKAVFVDFQSYQNRSLVEEAMRAELNVIEESEILTLKYKTMIEFCKNSSLV